MTGRVRPNAEVSERAKRTKECVSRQLWQSFVDDGFDLEHDIQTKAEFSSAIAVMDNIGGWNEEDLVGSRCAASMRIDTTAVICNGQNNMQECRLHKLRSIMEAVIWVCDDALDDHVWVSEPTISCKEAKVLELANPHIVEWCMFWFSDTDKSHSEVFERWSDP